MPLDINFHHLVSKSPDKEALYRRFEELNMKSFARKFSSGLKFGEPIEAIESKKNEDDVSLKITIQGSKIEEPVQDLKTIKDVKHDYYLIKNEASLDKLIKKLMSEELISFDTETTGLDFNEAKLVGMSFSYQENQGFYVPVFGEYESPEEESTGLFANEPKEVKPDVGIDIVTAIKKVKPFLESKKVKLVGQNIKFDYLLMKKYGIEMANVHFDTMVGSYILEPSEEHNMDSLSMQWLKYKPVSIKELIGKGKSEISMADVDVNIVCEYAVEDADVTLQLYHRINYELSKLNLIKLCEEIEFPLIKVLGDMEYEGIMVDRKVLNILDKELQKLIEEYEEKIYAEAGEKFNINSPSQLAKILTEKLHLELSKKTKTGFSTDVSVLEELRYKHPIAASLLEYRTMTKLKSTYIDGLLKAISERTGRVHTSFNQIRAATGRLSSVNPNLQNIPVRTEAGRNIRKAFVPKSDEYEILSADYSQVELRVMAHYSGDENFINAFKKNRDIHTETAMKVFNLKSKDEVTPNRRRKAKEVNFGIIYGIGAFGLATRLEIKNSEAKEIIDRYFKEFPRVYEYLEKTKKFARENGYVTTLKGRRRYLPQINNQNNAVKGEAERMAINMPIQGTAADMIKIAMIEIHNIFREKKFKSRMLLQVHDELVFEVYKPEMEEVKKIVHREMKNAIKLDVPIEVEIGTGKNWYEAH